MQIHSQYQSIIDILKNKITDTEDMIKIKRAAKGEFAYALSKNLLKTISNLSMEVMSLNQISLKDGEADERQTRKFMKEIDTVIEQKLKNVREFKKTVCQIEDDPRKANKKKKITFA